MEILQYIHNNKGSFEALADALGMEQDIMRLWLKTLVAEGYLTKAGDGYAISQKGTWELEFHSQA